MTVVIRVDGSSTVGWGHVRRCATLADAMRTIGAVVTFVVQELPGHPGPFLEARGFTVRLLATCDLANDWARDAAATADVIGAHADWLIVDHYALDARWETAARGAAQRVCAIDDLANRPHAVDVLIDQNLVAGLHQRYDALLPAHAVRLLGPEWALIDPAYGEAHDRVPARDGVVRRVHVSFGGADIRNVTGRVLAALIESGRDDLMVDVVVSSAHPRLDDLRAAAAGRPDIAVLTDVPDLVALLALADVAIGATGVTTWERLALGVPALVVTLADNQRPIASELHRRGVVTWLGDDTDVADETLRGAVRDLVNTPMECGMSAACFALVDGRGAARVSAVLTAHASTPVRARRAVPADELRVLGWANDPETRRQGFSPEPIALATHQQWFRRRLRNLAGCDFFIVETDDGCPAGQVRLERLQDEAWEVHYLVAPPFRGRRLGRAILECGLDAFARARGPRHVVGVVKSDNRASGRIFEQLGFTARETAGGVVSYHCEPWLGHTMAGGEGRS